MQIEFKSWRTQWTRQDLTRGALTGVTWDGSAIQSHGDDTVISNNVVKFGHSSRAHNGINVFYEDYRISKNTVTIFKGHIPSPPFTAKKDTKSE